MSVNTHKSEANPSLALIVSGHGRHYVIEIIKEGVRSRLIAHPRGKKSDVVVGDWVHWKISGDEAVIESIEPRRNLLYRQDDWRTKSFAANLDQLLLFIAVVPTFSESQLTRALIAASAADIPAHIVLNKIDLPQAPEIRERLQPYKHMGCSILELSLKHDPSAASSLLTPLLHGKSTLVLGPSGCGKSTLINRMVPHANATVGDISQALNAGRHTTTHTEWHWVDAEEKTALIDSPGFQEFGLHHIAAVDLWRHMPDIGMHAGTCRFYNCTHRQEPGCGIRAAVESGAINTRRWNLYTELFDELSRNPHG
jgi:ribosome biogenesis GTPase